MTLEEEIQKQEEKAMTYKSMGNQLSMNMSAEKQIRAMEDYHMSNYHKQLAEWLKELKAYREARKEINGLATVWEEGEGINKCRRILFKHLEEVNADEDCD